MNRYLKKFISLFIIFTMSIGLPVKAWHYKPNAALQPKTIRNTAGINPQVLDLAIKAYNKAYSRGEVKNKILSVIDYSKQSSEKRLWVFDMARKKLLYNTYVSHGSGSGNTRYATRFSNNHGSHQSSLGLFITGDTYTGNHGYSMRLHGKEYGVNHNAHHRAVVMHGAPYADSRFVQSNGYTGRSWGCPAIPVNLAKPVINKIKRGSVIFAYYPNRSWIKSSIYLA